MVENIFVFFTKLVLSIFTFLKTLFRSNLFLKTHKATGKTCLILGNGPSLKAVLKNDHKILSTLSLICVNKFPLTDHFHQLKPQYWIFASPDYWRAHTVDPNTPVRKEIVKTLVETVNWSLTVFCPNGAKSNPTFLNQFKQNPNLNLVFYNTTPVEGLTVFNNFFMKMGWGSPRPHNVLIPALLMAINSGFKNIALVGADHSWLPLVSVNEENVALVNQQHFYDENDSKSDIMYKEGVRARRLHEILEKFMLSFRSYFDLKSYAETRNVAIYNCTPGSFIDAFERKKLEDVFNLPPKHS